MIFKPNNIVNIYNLCYICNIYMFIILCTIACMGFVPEINLFVFVTGATCADRPLAVQVTRPGRSQ